MAFAHDFDEGHTSPVGHLVAAHITRFSLETPAESAAATLAVIYAWSVRINATRNSQGKAWIMFCNVDGDALYAVQS